MITFREHLREDIPFRVKWLNNHKAVLYAIHDPESGTTLEKQELWFKEYEEKLKKGIKKFFTILSDNECIGFMGLSHINKEVGNAKVFILIGEDEYRGRGIGRTSMDYLINFAFKDLGLKTLHLDVDKMNTPAINLYEKVGFQELGMDGKFILMTLSKNAE